MNTLACSVLKFAGGESKMLYCAVLLGGKAGNPYLRFIRSELRFIINHKAVGVGRSMSNKRTFLRPKMLRYAEEPPNPPKLACEKEMIRKKPGTTSS